MDVELIQKINNLALDLMRQGLAQDREDAVEQAEKVFKSRHKEGYAELREKIGTVEAQKQEDKEISSIDLTQDQVKTILEQNTQFLVRTIKEFKEKMTSLEKEMSDLRNKIAYNKLPTVNDIVSAKKTESREDVSDGQNKPVAQASHPRVGNFKDTDVSIEKFFYMG